MIRVIVLLVAILISTRADCTVLFHDDCEDAPNPQHWDILGVDPIDQPNSMFAYSAERSRSGVGSYKVVLPPIGVDGYNSLDKRTEARLVYVASPNINNFEIGREYWIGYSVYIPSDFKWPSEAINPAGDWLLIGQHHAKYEECDGILNPTGAMYFSTTPKVYIQIQAIKDQCWPEDDDDGLKDRLITLPAGGFSLVKGAWNDFVVNFRFDWDAASGPFYKMWHNDTLVVDDTGINTTNDGTCDTCGPYWKLGMYGIQDHWLTIYIDEVKVGDNNATYEEVAPSGNPSASTALSISTTTLGVWTQGSEASGTLAATGGTPPYTWAQTGAPAGFSLTASTGAWSITPTEAQAQIGQYDISVTCTDDDGNQATKQFSGTITATSTPTTPTVTSFELPATASTMTIPVTTFTGSASTAAYIITESASKPTAGATGWTATAPSSIIATVAGSVDFWAYVKDADGIVSSGSVETVTITISEQVVSGWTETATPNVWQATLATIEPLRLTLDGADGTLKALLDDVSATGDWFFASDIIYTYSVTDPDNTYTEIKAFTDSEPDSVTPAEAVLQVGGDKTINIGGKRIDVR